MVNTNGIIKQTFSIKCPGRACERVGRYNTDNVISAQTEFRRRGWRLNHKDDKWYCPECAATLDITLDPEPVTVWHMGKLNQRLGAAMREKIIAKKLGNKGLVEQYEADIKRITAELDRRAKAKITELRADY